MIRDDGIELNTKLEKPEGAERCPLAVIIHGFTGHMEERHIQATAETFLSLGCATLRVDMYGHGKSGGTFREHNLYKWINNSLRVLDEARKMDFVTDLYLCGHSQGGLTAMMAAGLKHEMIQGLIPMSPAWMIPEAARKGEILGVTFDPARIPEVIRSPHGWELDGNYVRVAQTLHVEEMIDRYTGPVLLIHGDADEAVPVEYARKAAGRYRNARLVILKGDTHCYDHHLPDAMEAIRQWMIGR